jgi:hypothetical protein
MVKLMGKCGTKNGQSPRQFWKEQDENGADGWGKREGRRQGKTDDLDEIDGDGWGMGLNLLGKEVGWMVGCWLAGLVGWLMLAADGWLHWQAGC